METKRTMEERGEGRMVRADDIDDDIAECPQGRRRLREMLAERESATERFRALKRRLLAKD